MELAVRYYGETSNPQGLPDEWPESTIEIADGAPLPDGHAHRFTLAGLETHKADRQYLFDAWEAAQTKTPYEPYPQAIFYTGNISELVDDNHPHLVPYNRTMMAHPHFFRNSDGTISLTRDQMRVEVMVEVAAKSTNNSARTQVDVWIAVNGEPVAGTRSTISCPARNCGGTAMSLGAFRWDEGDKIGVFIERTNGPADVGTVPYGCRIRLKEI